MSEFDKPSRAEDEYFAKQELERRKRWAEEQRAKMATDEKERLKQQHYMKCPKCGMDLATIEFRGIKLDRCPSCGGTWFDAGEVEQLTNPQNTGLFSKMMSVFK
jgi:rubrerythrin